MILSKKLVSPTKSESIDKQNTRQLVLLDLSIDAGYALYDPVGRRRRKKYGEKASQQLQSPSHQDREQQTCGTKKAAMHFDVRVLERERLARLPLQNQHDT